MGQQQLLLLVLGIVIVGLAVVSGIQAFGENQKKANADALTNDVIRIASDVQVWSLKPIPFGGGNGQFTNVTFEKLGYAMSGAGIAGVYTNLNASLSTGGANSGYRLSAPGPATLTITGCNLTQRNQVQAIVTGTGPSQIATTLTAITSC